MNEKVKGEKLGEAGGKSLSKITAKSDCAGSTNKIKGSLVKCEVKLDSGEWISPAAGSTYKIDADAAFPDVCFEIKTDVSGPYHWFWQIKWSALACPQRRDRKRYKQNKVKLYSMNGQFISDSKQWKANLDNKIVGGELTVRVEAASKKFVRRVEILGTEPGEARVKAELAQFSSAQSHEAELARKIFKQESKFFQFYSDGEPLVSFDNGYGLGQATNPVPSFEQVWNWKEHIRYIVTTVIKEKRILAKKYLDKHGNYTTEDLDMETLVHYNGANYHYLVWDPNGEKWIKNEKVLCDPEQSNSGWDMSSDANKNKSLRELQKGEGGKPKYTGRCYAEHIKEQESKK
ncbi:hypothetical protein [Massilia suwonensis]|uniref:Uncharacterized protein n=1 Tax=Massilia suwonensis TaxID=648895 RepID=A0ABW0MTK0_9BURK